MSYKILTRSQCYLLLPDDHYDDDKDDDDDDDEGDGDNKNKTPNKSSSRCHQVVGVVTSGLKLRVTSTTFDITALSSLSHLI